MGSETAHNVLMVSFPGQGHINPLLRLAKHLASKGLFITFSTTHNMTEKIQNSVTNIKEPTIIGDGQLRFELFTDGWDSEGDEPKRLDINAFMSQLETVGRDSFTKLVQNQFDSGRPVSCIINNPFIPWVTDVAADMGIPSAILWVQSCAVYSAYYHYLHNSTSFPTDDQPNLPVSLPGLPVLESDEIPSFLHPSSPYKSLKIAILGQFKNLSKSFCVLVDSIEEFEHEALQLLLSLSPIRPIGPLFKYPDESKMHGDVSNVATDDDSIKWLDSHPPASVVYVSFGTVAVVGKAQMEEIARGLLNSGLKFLWVVRPQPKELQDQEMGILPEGFIEEAEGKGLVVPWCPQDRVLVHPSVACFVTHCGWNSSMESLSSGVPIVAFPQWGDQVTNAKFLVDVFGVGVRLIRSDKDLKTFSREDVERCIVEVTRGDKAEEMKKNALKWKKVAEQAVAEGGSSDRNIQAFVDEVKRMGSERETATNVNLVN